MKNLVLAIGLGCSLFTGTYAAPQNQLEQLNNRIADVLSPFQTQSTVAQLIFDQMELSDERAEEIALHGLYRKIGHDNTFELKLDNLSYNYDNGIAPITVFKGSLGLDLSKVIPQDKLNYLIPSAMDMIEILARDYIREYGAAVSTKGVVTSTTKDHKGNYTGLTALFSMKIDLDKLPEEDHESVMLTDAVFSLSLNTKTGMGIDAYVVSNPDYIGFKRDQAGLKEELLKLMDGNEASLFSIHQLFEELDLAATDAVERLTWWKNINFKK